MFKIASELRVPERMMLFCLASDTPWDSAGITHATARHFAPGDLIAVMLVVACVVVFPLARGTALAENPVTQAVIARETFACQSPWQVLEGHGCRKLAAGTEVDVVSGDDFFACVVWPDTQRCMWVARDALRKR